MSPVKGWGSIATENGYIIIEPLSARPRYRVVYPEGVIVRSAADIDDSDFVRVIAKGEVVEGTGQVQMYDNVERIQVGKDRRGVRESVACSHTAYHCSFAYRFSRDHVWLRIRTVLVWEIRL